ncbi:MAG: hypothetical protein GQ573_04630 [Gammaproteobacteria bacterium]|nr:hypothetical protein [Gammaproteobacteria bacterium]
MPLKESHAIADTIELLIEKRFATTDISIHVEPETKEPVLTFKCRFSRAKNISRSVCLRCLNPFSSGLLVPYSILSCL